MASRLYASAASTKLPPLSSEIENLGSLMLPKRNLTGGGEDGDHSNKRRRLFSNILRGTNDARAMQEIVSCLEPSIRKWVGESVDDSFRRFMRSSNNQIECSGSRTLQLQFQGNLPHTLFTGSRILSEDRSPIRIVLYDSSSKQIVTSGPQSSIKVHIVVLDGDFGLGDQENWTKTEFDRKIVHNREGKRPLVTGELTVPLQDGVGFVGEVIFTDNSSWIRSGKFRLGARVQSNSNEINVKEGMSNAFKVKDHRGESYQKHHPPYLNDEVWRLEKIAKDGASHKRLTDAGVRCVQDFLRLYFRDQSSLRTILGSMSNKVWETIMRHALTCTLDEQKYMYRATQEIVLYFNSVHKLLGVSFGGQGYHSMDNLDLFQTKMVESLKSQAYKESREWVLVCDQPTIGYPMLLNSPEAIDFNSSPNLLIQDANFRVEQDNQLGLQMNKHRLSISPSSYNCDVDQDSGSYEIGESSHHGQGFDPTFGNSYMMSNSSGGFFMENFVGTRLSTDDLPIEDNFQVGLSAWQGNGLFLGSSNHETGIISSNTGILIPRKTGSPKTQWCKVLAVVKWRILVRRNVAARKWKQSYYYI